MKPYKDLEITDQYIIREFSDSVDPIELLWHRATEDRTSAIVRERDWAIKLQNKLPTSLTHR